LFSRPSAARNTMRARSTNREAAMHQTKKGNQWYFGMKAH
jgi:IS5 family transposase